MKEMRSYEQEMSSWKPRRPSGRMARRIFGDSGPAPVALRRASVWLTPLAACALTMLLAVGNLNRHVETEAGRDDSSSFATEIPAADSSIAGQTVRLSQMDENVQWNVWSKINPPEMASPSQPAPMVEESHPAATNLNR